jgi:hypothetical protein
VTLRADLEARLTEPAAAGSFTRDELEGLPELARRFLVAAIAPGTPLAVSARLGMRGSIKLGKGWLAFRAREVLSPHRGFMWAELPPVLRSASVCWLMMLLGGCLMPASC